MDRRTRLLLGVLAVIVIVAVAITVAVLVCVPRQEAFPIDVVCLWVDGSDAAWTAAAAAAFEAEQRAHPNCGVVHSVLREPAQVPPFAKDELYYSCRMIRKFMPWVRTYYLVTARPHRPWWWQDRMGSMRCVIVHHADIFDDPSRLPCFNSVTIQTQLSNIPGLAEHFILFDDDFFVGQPLERSDFFTANGAKAVMRTYPLLPYAMPPGNWRVLCENMLAMGVDIVGKGVVVQAPDHVATPLFKSVFREVTHVLAAQRTALLHKFRSSVDYVPHYVTAMAMLARGMIVPPSSRIGSAFLGYMDKARTETFKRPPHLFCINDRITPEDTAYLEKLVN
jgi:hypothetical protein